MPYYLLQVAYTPESFKAMLASPSDRKAAAAKVTEAAGAKLHQFFFAFGKYDAILIVEAPDDSAVAGAMQAIRTVQENDDGGASGTERAGAGGQGLPGLVGSVPPGLPGADLAAE